MPGVQVPYEAPTDLDLVVDAERLVVDENIYVREFQAIVENNQITQYRVNCKITFVVED